jgi:hypothetical protein
MDVQRVGAGFVRADQMRSEGAPVCRVDLSFAHYRSQFCDTPRKEKSLTPKFALYSSIYDGGLQRSDHQALAGIEIPYTPALRHGAGIDDRRFLTDKDNR